ncbi:MAG: serine/threonine protein kinase, partial [Candidatus Binatia bacterium]
MVTPTGIVPGSRIGGKYEVVEVIGYGGMGVVYKVREQVGAVSRIRALKTVLPRHATNPSIVTRFREEAEKMCLLEHDNLVPVLSYSEEGEFPYLVMPFIEGQTLKEFLAAHMAKFGRPLPLVDVAEIGLQITRGLDVAHHFSNAETGKVQPIIHRDIKPGNIMVRTEGRAGERNLRVLIMDFGIAKLVSDEDTGHTLTDVIGTVKYASPEQVQRSKDIDPRADIYSLGMVLYELYSGHHVFADTSEHGVLMRMMQRELEEIVPKFSDGTPSEFRELITKCVAVQREARWADVAEVRALLKQIHDIEKARRSDDSRQAEELAMTSRTTAMGTGASEFAASAFNQAEKIAEQAKAARDKSLHTEATQLFQQAVTAFEQAAGFASQARERELLVARIAAVRPVREAAVAAGAESLAAEAFAEAVRATEAAERALASNDLATVEREAHHAELAWRNARQTAEREAARREADAARQELTRALSEESEKLDALSTGIRSVEAVKRLGEA